jgi:hypothetical protein
MCTADIRNNAWHDGADGTRERTLQYSIKVETPLGTKQSDTTDAQRLRWWSKAAFDLDSDVTAEGVPYASTFCMRFSTHG